MDRDRDRDRDRDKNRDLNRDLNREPEYIEWLSQRIESYRNSSVGRPMERPMERLEMYRRIYLMLFSWYEKMECSSESVKAIEEWTEKSFVMGYDISDYQMIINGLRGKEEWPSYIKENLEVWIECVELLVEPHKVQLCKEDLEEAIQRAHSLYAADLEALINEDRIV